jgi:glycerophosphoryl diester phosphodiesterase
MLEAVRLGVTTLELDVVMTADQQILVSHEPFMNPEICLDLSGRILDPASPQAINLFKMRYEQIRQYDCGSKPHPRFPDQRLLPVHKPLLSELFAAVEQYIQERGMSPVRYNIEIKSVADQDNISQPIPSLFADAVLAEIARAGLGGRCMIQSFDVRPLQYINRNHGNQRIPLAYLVEGGKDAAVHLKELGFMPAIYSPLFHLLDKKKVDQLHKQGIRVVPWTVNEVSDMEMLIEMGVDGIITDYPDRLIQVVRERKLPGWAE